MLLLLLLLLLLMPLLQHSPPQLTPSPRFALPAALFPSLSLPHDPDSDPESKNLFYPRPSLLQLPPVWVAINLSLGPQRERASDLLRPAIVPRCSKESVVPSRETASRGRRRRRRCPLFALL